MKSFAQSKAQAQQPQITSRLHDLARVYNWEAVIARSMSHPVEASYLGPDRLNALHHVCNRRPPADVVEALLHADATQAEVQDVKGWTALHYACRFKANPMVVQHLLTASRASSMLRDLNCRSPLYYAIRYDAPQEVIQQLVSAFPGSIMQCDHAGASPISLIWTSFATSFLGKRHIDEAINELQELKELEGDDVEKRRNYQFQGKRKLGVIWKRVVELLSLSWQKSGNPNPNNEKNNSAGESFPRKWLLLHAMSSFPCHIKMWQLAKALHPEQAFVIDQDTGRLPLHFVAAYVSTGFDDLQHGRENCRYIMRELLEINPAAAMHRDKSGNTPLAIAVRDKQWEEDGLSDLFKAYPEALCVANSDGRLPLHTAASSDCAWPCVVRNLLHHYLQGAQTCDGNGALSLHLAVAAESSSCLSSSEEQSSSSSSMHHNMCPVNMNMNKDHTPKYVVIYEAFPEAVGVRDNRDRLPLHAACASIDASPLTINKLLNLYPDAVQMQDYQGKTPLMLAAESGKDWDTGLGVLFERFPQGASRMDHRGFVPFHVLAMMTSSLSSSSSSSVGAVSAAADDLTVLSTMFRLLKQDPSCFASYCISNDVAEGDEFVSQ